MLVHSVYFWLNTGISPADRRLLERFARESV